MMSPSESTVPAEQASRGIASRGRLFVALATTIGLALLANQIQDIGGRIPYVFLILWFGSATMVALVFVPNHAESQARSDKCSTRHCWSSQMYVAGQMILPLGFVPILEMLNTGPDPMIWLMNGALLISLCSTPYFALLSRQVLGAVVLTWGAITVLWIPCATVLFQLIKRAEMARDVSTVDTANTMHAFFAPEYRYLFYILSAGVVFLYCPIMLLLSYRRFRQSSEVDAKS